MLFKKRSEQFEYGLQQAARGASTEGRLAPLFQTVCLLSVLSGPVPAPHNGLAPGRQRFLAEGARLQATLSQGSRRRRPAAHRTMRLATVAVTALLLFGVVFGVGSASAASLPGNPLYGLKLAAESIHTQLTTSPEAQANLAVSHAEKRLSEIAELVERGRAVDETTITRAEHQLELAVTAADLVDSDASAAALERLQTAIRIHRRTMQSGLSKSPEKESGPVRDFVRVMERTRRELQSGVGESAGSQERLRNGSPPGGEEIPVPGARPGPGPGPMDTPGSNGPNYGTEPGPGPQAGDAPYGPWEPSPPSLGNGPPAGEPGPPEGPGSAEPTEVPACKGAPGECGKHGGSPAPTPDPDPVPTPMPQGPGPHGRPGRHSSEKGS